MIEFSCADFAFPVLSHEKALALIALMDFRWVDIGLFENRSHIQPSNQLDNPEECGRILKNLTNRHGLRIADIFLQTSLDFSEYGINHPDVSIRNSQREIFRRAIDYCAAAGCPQLSGLPGVNYCESSYVVCVDELAWRVEYAGRHSIIYSVEPHFGSIMAAPEDALAILKEVQGLKVVLDHSHYTAQGIDIERVRPLAAYASHIHARGAAMGEMQTSVTRNMTDFEKAAEHIKEVGYGGFVCLEYTYVDWENCNRTDNVSETLLLREKLTSLLGTHC